MKASLSRRGAALVIVLSFVAVLTVLLTAFFSRALLVRRISGTSAAASRSDQLAQTALGFVVGDLRAEIAAGSRVDVSNGVSIYLPVSAAASQPARILAGDETNLANVVRYSQREATFLATFQALPFSGQYTAFPTNNLASAVGTADATATGRAVSFASWMKPQLIAPAVTNAFQAPDWVLVTRNGPKAFAAWSDALKDASTGNPDFAVGRYAYVVYDEGGLLDVTVAGRPSGIPQAELSKRSQLALADLTQIPGVANQAAVDKLVAWRNASLASTPYGSDTNSYFGYVTNAATTFLRVRSGDQTFLGRQDLLAYAFNNPTILGPAALPYLGTFSREVNAPSFHPALTNFKKVPVDPSAAATARPKVGDSGVTADGSAQRASTYGLDTTFNPSLAAVRWPADATLSDGTKVRAGTSLLRQRFPLDRLALLVSAGAVTKSDSDPVYRYFGLYRSAATAAWTYDHGDAARIMTLPALAKAIGNGTVAARDPDFFELLQAGIAIGSLGRDAGSGTAGGANVMLADQNTYAQILQIGANIIDQYDADDYPTEIAFGAISVYGIENLPYIDKVSGSMAVDGSQPDQAGGWYIFSLWNPHQNPTILPAFGGPTTFRIVPEPGSSAFLLLGRANDVNASVQYGAPVTYPTDINSGQYELDFQRSATCTFLQPTLIAPTTAGLGLSTPSTLPQMQVQTDASGNKWQGIFAGNHACQIGDTIKSTSVQESPTVTFALQYQAADNSWHTYNRLKYYSGTGAKKTLTGATLQTFTMTWAYFGFRIDPRTDRFAPGMAIDLSMATTGHETMWGTMQPNNNDQGFAGFGTYLPAASSGFFNINKVFYNLLAVNTETGDINHMYYQDPDGVVRRGVQMFGTVGNADTLDKVAIYGLPMSMDNSVSRPVILNRPFRSVGELGYVHRDMPWKNLDFYSGRSGDSALLDLFTVDQAAPLVAGRVSINTRNAPVLQSLLAGALENEVAQPASYNAKVAAATFPSAYLLATEATAFAQRMVAVTQATPFHNRSDLVNRLPGDDTGYPQPTPDTWGAGFTQTPPTASRRIVERREAAVRALNDSLNGRTWNLLIDVVAQTGRYAPIASTLPDFQIDGERRYWLHVAIDRYTGQIVDEQLEAVTVP